MRSDTSSLTGLAKLALPSKISTTLRFLICLIVPLSVSAEVLRPQSASFPLRHHVDVQLVHSAQAPTRAVTPEGSQTLAVRLTIASLNPTTKETTQITRLVPGPSSPNPLHTFEFAMQLRSLEVFAQQLEEALNTQTISLQDLAHNAVEGTVDSATAAETKWSEFEIESIQKKISAQKSFRVRYQNDLSTTLACHAQSCETYKHFVVTGPTAEDDILSSPSSRSSTTLLGLPIRISENPLVDNSQRSSSFVQPEALAPIFEAALNNKTLSIAELQKLISTQNFFHYMTLYPSWQKLSPPSNTQIAFEYLDEWGKPGVTDPPRNLPPETAAQNLRVGRFTITSSALINLQTDTPTAVVTPPFWIATKKDLKSPQELMLLFKQALFENKIHLSELIAFLQRPDWHLRSSFRNYESLISLVTANSELAHKRSHVAEFNPAGANKKAPSCENIVSVLDSRN